MKINALNKFKRLLLVGCLGLGGFGSAQAGLVSGSWDPAFGSFLSHLSWSGLAEFWVPDTCSAQADGIYSASGLCGGTTVNSANVTFTGDLSLPGSQTIDFAPLGLTPTAVKVAGNQVVAVATTGAGLGVPSGAPAAQGNAFVLQFTATSPILLCIACSQNGPDYINNAPNVAASVNGMEQTFYTYTDGGAPKLVDAYGYPVGVKLGSDGDFIGYTSQPVPEPGTWALMLGGLMAVALRMRRRR